MEQKLKMKLALAIACVGAISLYFTVHHWKRRNRKASKGSCYLDAESKPQSSFKRVLADNSFTPFKHLNLNDTTNAKPSNLHPYEMEIKALLKNHHIDCSFLYETSMTDMSESYVWVESDSQLRELVDVLSKQKVFAVDTEQHSLRSFLGFTALVQISTGKEDYLIDTIALHDVMDMLQPIFADPNILKVFHGADSDVLWLQRDFHIYVVNMFDTAKACEVLSKQQKSLAYLLDTNCGVTANKLLQREDWRQRPLPQEMVEYARADAHYLLYIARCLISELQIKDNDINVRKNSANQYDKLHFLLEASRRSNTSCLQMYLKEDEAFPGESAASSILSRNFTGQGIASQRSFKPQYRNHVTRLCAWRDLMARVHDESLRYILSDQAIVALADKSPTSKGDIFNTIAQADLKHDLSASSFTVVSPSPCIFSHWEDVCCLLKDGESTSSDILQILLQKHLGPNGTCSVSIYNYSLLYRCNWKLEKRSIPLQGVKNGKQVGHKASRALFVKKFSCKAPVYHNCRIYASDGRLLCYCDRKKLEWYLNRHLAKLVEDNPPAIMLLFEPKGRPEDEDNDFYIQSKRNMCVGCGERNHYLRYRIIPSCCRMHFPEHLKSHRSHDIVLLCVDCHEVAHAAAEKYKRQIAAEFGIPLFVRKVVESGQTRLPEASELHTHEGAGVSPLQLRTAAMALLRHGQRMPSKRREELIEIVKTYFGGRQISHKDLEAALLVGMSPQERRKFEKKRGLSNKDSATSIFLDEAPENDSDNPCRALNNDLSETSRVNGSLDLEDQASSAELGNKSETNLEEPSLEVKEDTSSIDGFSVTMGNKGIAKVIDVNLVDAENNSHSRTPSNGTAKLCVTNPDERTYNSKVSLLGHGPHGEEVVTHLLKKYGEDGIRQFCERWRQVFVDAVHPRYLPAGWDIKHSGRREFGEFSVYKSAKELC